MMDVTSADDEDVSSNTNVSTSCDISDGREKVCFDGRDTEGSSGVIAHDAGSYPGIDNGKNDEMTQNNPHHVDGRLRGNESDLVVNE